MISGVRTDPADPASRRWHPRGSKVSLKVRQKELELETGRPVIKLFAKLLLSTLKCAKFSKISPAAG